MGLDEVLGRVAGVAIVHCTRVALVSGALN